jgi:hypothetical protein
MYYPNFRGQSTSTAFVRRVVTRRCRPAFARPLDPAMPRPPDLQERRKTFARPGGFEPPTNGLEDRLESCDRLHGPAGLISPRGNNGRDSPYVCTCLQLSSLQIVCATVAAVTIRRVVSPSRRSARQRKPRRSASPSGECRASQICGDLPSQPTSFRESHVFAGLPRSGVGDTPTSRRSTADAGSSQEARGALGLRH